MVSRRGSDVDALTREGTSCLYFVCRPKHASSAMARDLLEAGSNPNVGLTKTGITALHYAAQSNELELCRLLLKHGADASIKDKDGFFPTKYAVDAGFGHIAELMDNALVSAVENNNKDDEFEEEKEKD